jgi:hypothetical protein
MGGRATVVLSGFIWASTLLTAAETAPGPISQAVLEKKTTDAGSGLFEPSGTCRVCHSNLITRTGEGVSIFADWETSTMANSARDPYWLAAVRREVMDHPADREEIEDECSICHMPMTSYAERAAGRRGRVFDYLRPDKLGEPSGRLAADGVSCTVCHQIQPANLGTQASFTGGYEIDITPASGQRRAFGPFHVDAGRARVMQSASGFQPTQGAHLQQSELCATCHTLFTRARPSGIRLPEQMPYQEWQLSAFKDSRTCQSCHMPVVEGDMPLTQVLGQPREGVSRHTFLGGNFFMMKMLDRYRAELGVTATSREFDAALARTVRHLQEDTSSVNFVRAQRDGDTLGIEVEVENLAGHKLPTAYPSRRVWIHLAVRDASGKTVFESGAFSPDGRIAGNDNDQDGSKYEPHHVVIERAEDVQVYESIMVDSGGRVTTGLLSGVKYVKDNRLLPKGMTIASAAGDVAVHGPAAEDADFGDGRDRVRYRVPISGVTGPLTASVELWYQPIGYRWAVTLRGYDAPEPRRFVGFWDSMAGESAMVLSRASATVK